MNWAKMFLKAFILAHGAIKFSKNWKMHSSQDNGWISTGWTLWRAPWARIKAFWQNCAQFTKGIDNSLWNWLGSGSEAKQSDIHMLQITGLYWILLFNMKFVFHMEQKKWFFITVSIISRTVFNVIDNVKNFPLQLTTRATFHGKVGTVEQI